MKILLSQMVRYRQRKDELKALGFRSYVTSCEGMERIAYGSTELGWKVMVNELMRKERSKGRYGA